MIRIIILVSITLTIVLNVIGIYYVDILFYGFFIMIAILSFIASKYTNIPNILLITLFLTIFSSLTKILINFTFNYAIVTETGEELPPFVIFMGSVMTLIVSEFLSVITAGIGKWIFKEKKS